MYRIIFHLFMQLYDINVHSMCHQAGQCSYVCLYKIKYQMNLNLVLN